MQVAGTLACLDMTASRQRVSLTSSAFKGAYTGLMHTPCTFSLAQQQQQRRRNILMWHKFIMVAPCDIRLVPCCS